MNTCILIATYNEASNISKILDQLKFYDVLIVDDNSPDGTAEICKKYSNVEVLSRFNKKGIASAYLDGFKHIILKNKYDIIVQMDAGLTHNPQDIKGMIECFLSKNYDLLIGSRDIKKQKIISFRTILSKFAIICMSFLGINVNDASSGFRIWNADFLKKISFDKITANGFAFQLQMLFYTKILSGKIGEFKINYILTNSSLNKKIIFEAIYIFLDLLIRKFFRKA